MKKRVNRSHDSGSDKPWQILFSLHPTLKDYSHHINSKGTFQSGFFEGRHLVGFRMQIIHLQSHPIKQGEGLHKTSKKGRWVPKGELLRKHIIANSS